MLLSDFDFFLPKSLVAQYPVENRDCSSLLIAGENLNITKFYNITNFLRPKDLLIFNDTKVINAKLILDQTKKIAVNLNREISHNCWHCFGLNLRKVHNFDCFIFDTHKVLIKEKLADGQVIIEFLLNGISSYDFLNQYGQIPLPPYIKRDHLNQDDLTRYQTVYSKNLGSVAAPTAGLHFTKTLLSTIKNMNVDIDFVTLNVGAGTFLPVKTENILDHKMHTENFFINDQVAAKINLAKSENRRIIAVGTTTLRALESSVLNGFVKSGYHETQIFIKPGYKFQIPDMLITNFHLPKTTLFMLICAFVGKKHAFDIYNYAIENKMRFFSYGDASLLYLNKDL